VSVDILSGLGNVRMGREGDVMRLFHKYSSKDQCRNSQQLPSQSD
jgi:hypothetical protein